MLFTVGEIKKRLCQIELVPFPRQPEMMLYTNKPRQAAFKENGLSLSSFS